MTDVPSVPIPPPPPPVSSPASQAFGALRQQVAQVVVGQDDVITGILIGFLARGHVLLEGVPGVAKTLLVKSLAAGMGLESNRLQFTPDLMPSDVTGQMIYENGSFRFRAGPVFTNLLLADEINRTPPKTQAALLESMEEGQVSTDGQTRKLPAPFMVVATQNPVEYEGTYPLPEAQLDRFLLKVAVDYPPEADEIEVLRRHHVGVDMHDPANAGVQAVLTPSLVAAAWAEVAAVTVTDELLAYMVALGRASRTSPSLDLGVSPRGAIALLKSAKASAWLGGQTFVTPDHVKAVAGLALQHRVLVKPELEIEGISGLSVVEGIVNQVPTP